MDLCLLFLRNRSPLFHNHVDRGFRVAACGGDGALLEGPCPTGFAQFDDPLPVAGERGLIARVGGGALQQSPESVMVLYFVAEFQRDALFAEF